MNTQINQKEAFVFQLSNFTKISYAIFYENSVIFNYLDKKKKKELAKKLKSDIKSNKIPLLKRGEFSKTFWENIGEQYIELTHEEILNQNKENFELKYFEIEKIKLSPYRTETTNPNEEPPIAGQLWVIANEEKYHFNHKYKKEHEKVSLLKNLFHDKFVMLK